MAEAIGQPGQRRFRLRATNANRETASLWMEKEQLTALGEAIENVLRDESYRYQRLPLDDAELDPAFPLDSEVEMRIAQLTLGINRDGQRIVVIGADGPADDDDTNTVALDFDYRHGYELRRQIAEVVAAGRPPCPLCGGPLDPQGHICPRTNGHHPS